MAWTYILKGSTGRHYIGSTVNLAKRFRDHQNGNTYTTRRLGRNLRIIASRKFPTLKEARTMERILKNKKNPALAIDYLGEM